MTTTPIPVAIIGSGIFVKEQHLVSKITQPLVSP